MAIQYSAFIFITKDQLLAINLDKNGRCEKISIDGNVSMLYRDTEDIIKYFGYVREYYNVLNFSDIDIAVTIVNLTQKASNMWSIIEQIKDVKEINCLTGEKIIPFVACLKDIIKENNKATIGIINAIYDVEYSDMGTFSCNPAVAKEDIVDLSPEDFASCLMLNRKMFGGDEVKFQQLYEEEKKKVATANIRFENEKKKVEQLNVALKAYLRNKNREIIQYHTDELVYGACVNYLVDNDTVVKKGTPLFRIKTKKMIASKRGTVKINLEVEAPRSGRFFYIIKDEGEIKVKKRNDIGVLGNEDDTVEEVLNWYYGPSHVVVNGKIKPAYFGK